MALFGRLRSLMGDRNRNAQEWYNAAITSAQRNRPQDAIDALRRALAAAPQTPDLLVRVALALEKLGEVDVALLALNRACKLEPQAPQPHLTLGEMLLRLKRPSEALQPLDRALTLTDFGAEACLRYGQALEAMNDLEAALSHYHLGYREAPDNMEVARALGRLQSRLGHVAGAIRTWSAVLIQVPSDTQAMTALGVVLSATGRHSEALELLTKVAKARPDSPDAHSDIALALCRSGAHDAAYSAVQQALALKPKSPELLLNLAFVELGRKRRAEALAIYSEVVALAPGWARAHLGYGMALRDAGDIAGARAAIERALTLAPNDPRCKRALAELDGGRTGFAVEDWISGQTKSQPPNVAPPLAEVHDGSRPPPTPSQDLLPPRASSISSDLPRPSSHAITGEIEYFSLPDVLEFLVVRRSTGLLLVSSDSGEGMLKLREGQLAGGASPNVQDIVSMLVSLGILSSTILNERSPRTPPDVLAVELLATGAVDRSSLTRAYSLQVESVIEEIISWKQGAFSFGDDPNANVEPPVLLDARGVLMEVMRKLDEGSLRG